MKMIYPGGLRKLISMVVIITFVFYGDIFVYSQSAGDIDKQFQKAKDEYNNGQYVNAKNRIERIIGTIKGKGQEKKDIIGACYLLLGAIYEKRRKTNDAKENYRIAKEKYSVESIAGVDFDDLSIYKRIVKGIIEKKGGRKKKKSPWPWIVGGVVVAITIFILTHSKKKYYKLRVEKGDGIRGYPEDGLYTYIKGTTVNYDYNSLQDGPDPIVTINGSIFPSKGTIKMDKDYNLTASLIRLHIESTPSGSEVYVDNQNKGILTPCDFSLSPGMHEIRLVKNGYGEAKKTDEVFEKNTDYHLIVELSEYTYECVGSWGEQGDGEGKFQLPSGIAIDKEDNVYIADGANSRIQIFNSNGGYIDKWGEKGDEEGKFMHVEDIAIDKNGYIYVLDSNGRVQKFNSNKKFILQWGDFGTEYGKFIYPKGISVDQDDFVYVADGGNNRIQKFDSIGNFKRQLGTDGDVLRIPWDIVFDKDNNAYVCDSYNHRIQKFDSNGNRLTPWGKNGNGKDDMTNPIAVAVDDKNVYACDQGKNRIQKFDHNGKFICKWGEEGSGNGQFRSPRSIAVNKDGYIYVVDLLNDNVQKFKKSQYKTEDDGKWDIVTTAAINSNSSLKTHSKFPDKDKDKKQGN